jgi:cysteine desulfurase
MIYLDHAATTPVDPEVLKVVAESMWRDFGNPGTVYRIGLDARKRVEAATGRIAELLNLPATHRVIYTSGGSESNNLFIKGLCFPDKKAAHLGLEHPSVTETLAYLAETGNVPVSLLEHQVEGRLGLESLGVLAEKRVRLLCLSHVNNELGSVNDPAPLVRALEAASPATRLFLDGVQAVGKRPLVDMPWDRVAGYSLSAHKMNGPKGIGLLVYDARLRLTPLIHGGKQQHGVRSGTLPVPLILGLVKTLERAIVRAAENEARFRALSRRLIDGLREQAQRLPELHVLFNSLAEDDTARQSPAIVNFSFPPVEGEVLLHHLEEKGIYVGLGSACSAQSKEPSRILTGIGRGEEEARASLRVSFGPENTLDDVDRFLEEFSRAYRSLYPTFKEKAAAR